jgi:GNAT superfamily N-acetyltransferase
MKVKSLKHIKFDTLLDCFFLAFENYFVPLPTDRAYYKERWKMAKVDYRFSYGMFDGEQLVGFIINAIDPRNGEMIAFNTGTGVLPNYRGKKITKSIYDFALSDLKANGINKCLLEVIILNKAAIKSYQSIGFEITRAYKCFSGSFNTNKKNSGELLKIPKEQFNWNNLPNQNNYSWDNQKETVSAGEYEYYHILNNEALESYFIIDSKTGYIPQLDCFNPSNESWNNLFTAIQSVSQKVKINNVDTSLTEKMNHINHSGLTNTIDQHEMELIIS